MAHHPCDHALLVDLIRRGQWDTVECLCDNNPTIIEIARTKANNTILHELCSNGSAPYALVKKVMHIWNDATMLQNKHGDTPLHLTTRVSQDSSYKVKLLVECNQDALNVKNNAGQTPLGTACVSNARLDVIELLVDTCPALLLVKDEYGRTPAELLWSSVQKNIPGSLAIRRYLNDGGEMGNILTKAWSKFQFCIMESYRYSNAGQGRDDTSIMQPDNMLCHAIIDQNVQGGNLDQVLAIALTIEPNLAMQVDEKGNTPLHILAGRNNDLKAINAVLQKCPHSATKKNKDGRLPLHIAVNKGKEEYFSVEKWRKIVNCIVEANIDALDCQDGEKGNLYPFMIAASEGDVQLTYSMLLQRPAFLFFM